MRSVVAGRLQYREIADRLHASMRAVESHAALLHKLDVTDRRRCRLLRKCVGSPGNSQPGAANDLAAVSKTCGLCAACRVAVRCGAPVTSYV